MRNSSNIISNSTFLRIHFISFYFRFKIDVESFELNVPYKVMDRVAHDALDVSKQKEPVIIYYSTVNMKPRTIATGTQVHEETSLFQVKHLVYYKKI